MQRLFIILAIICAQTSLFAQQDDIFFPDAFEPQKELIRFETLQEDSVRILQKMYPDKDDKYKNKNGEIILYTYRQGEQFCIAIKRPEGWVSAQLRKETGWRESFEIESGVADNSEKDLLLIMCQSSSDGRGGRYGGFDVNNAYYSIINTRTGEDYYIGEVYEHEIHGYNGMRYPDVDEDEEMKEMDKEENWDYTRDAVNYTVSIYDGKIVFEYFEFAGAAADSNTMYLDTVRAIEYILKDGKLVKDRVLPEFKNNATTDNYKVLHGIIGNYPVTMHLEKHGRSYSGYYFYNSKQRRIDLQDRYYMDSTVGVVLFEHGNKLFKGEIEKGHFSGKWTDGKKELQFELVELYKDGEIPLRYYSFGETLLQQEDNTYRVGIAMYLPDTSKMQAKDKAEWFNKFTEGYIGRIGEAEDIARHKYSGFRQNMLESVGDDIFKYAEHADYYDDYGQTEKYNQNYLLCIETHRGSYMGGASVGRSHSYTIFDFKKNKRISKEDILTCADSVLCNIIEESLMEQYADDMDEQGKYALDAFRMAGDNVGSMVLEPGGFSFFYPTHMMDYWIYVPFVKVNKYLKPEYKQRLLPN